MSAGRRWWRWRWCWVRCSRWSVQGARAGASILELDLNEHHLAGPIVDDVVLDASLAVIGVALGQHDGAFALGRGHAQGAAFDRHHDVVPFMPVPAGMRAGREAVFGHPYPVG